MRATAAEIAALSVPARPFQARKTLGQVTGFEIFVSGKLRNLDNGPQNNWKVKAGYRKGWRSRVEAKVGYFLLSEGGWPWSPEYPKRVYLRAQTHNVFDADGLAAALKPIVDGLRDARILHSDRPDSGHEIEQDQKIARLERGVLIRVTLGEKPGPARPAETDDDDEEG